MHLAANVQNIGLQYFHSQVKVRKKDTVIKKCLIQTFISSHCEKVDDLGARAGTAL